MRLSYTLLQIAEQIGGVWLSAAKPNPTSQPRAKRRHARVANRRDRPSC